jgi:hypothetical protein
MKPNGDTNGVNDHMQNMKIADTIAKLPIKFIIVGGGTILTRSGTRAVRLISVVRTTQVLLVWGLLSPWQSAVTGCKCSRNLMALIR